MPSRDDKDSVRDDRSDGNGDRGDVAVSAVRLTMYIYGIKSVFALLNKTYPRPLRPLVTMMKKPLILQRNSRETRPGGVARNVMMMGPKALQQDLAIRFRRVANKEDCGDAPCPTTSSLSPRIVAPTPRRVISATAGKGVRREDYVIQYCSR